jgi:hypothetical protein
MIKTTLLITALTFSLSNAFGHAFWVKTNNTGKKGQLHQVEVFFAEPAGKPELIDGEEMKSVKKFSVWLLVPGQEKKKLELIPATDHYKTSFTPQHDGLYKIVLQNEDIAVVDYQQAGIFKSDFYASAVVKVGAIQPLSSLPSGFKFNIIADQKSSTGKRVTIVLEHQQIDLSKVTLSVYNQQGWKLDVKLGKESGKGFFDVLGPGLYFLEAAYNDKINGTYNGKAYNSYYCAATQIIDVVK